MTTTTLIDMRTHGYSCPYGYAYSWLLLPLWIYVLMATTTLMDIYTHSYYYPHECAHL